MKRVLVPIDFSDVTPQVIDLARQLAKALDAEIHLVHVKELTAAAAPGMLGYGLAGMPELAPDVKARQVASGDSSGRHQGQFT